MAEWRKAAWEEAAAAAAAGGGGLWQKIIRARKSSEGQAQSSAACLCLPDGHKEQRAERARLRVTGGP